MLPVLQAVQDGKTCANAQVDDGGADGDDPLETSRTSTAIPPSVGDHRRRAARTSCRKVSHPCRRQELGELRARDATARARALTSDIREAVVEGLGVGVGVALAEGDGVGDQSGLGEGLGDAAAVQVGLAEGCNDGLGETAGEDAGLGDGEALAGGSADTTPTVKGRTHCGAGPQAARR